MRDYAEIGWRVVSGGRRERGKPTPLTRVWSTLASPVTTTVLALLIGGLLLLDAGSSGATLPTEDQTRFGPLALRVCLAVLALNFLVVVLQRAVPSFSIKRARPNDLNLASAFEHRRAIPFTPESPRLSEKLVKAGARAARKSGVRRVFGVTGRLALVGAALAGIGGILLLSKVVAGLDDPPPGELVLREGQATETLLYESNSQRPLEAYLGYAFTIVDSQKLAEDVRGTGRGDAALLVSNLADDSVQELALGTDARVGLPDGSMLRFEGLREISEPAAATLRITNRGASREQTVSVGDTVDLNDRTSVVVSQLTWDYLDTLGPAVEFAGQGGQPFVLFQRAPGLLTAHLPTSGIQMEVVGMKPAHEVTVSRVYKQDGTLAVVGITLLLLGSALLLVSGHMAISVDDEVDRIVVRGTSINDALAVPDALSSLSEQLAGEFEGGALTPEELAALTRDEEDEDPEEDEDSEEDEGDEGDEEIGEDEDSEEDEGDEEGEEAQDEEKSI